MAFPTFKSSRVSEWVHWIGLGIIAALTFHAISTLLLAVLGVAPSSENWSLLLTLAGVLAVSGAAVGIQSYLYKSENKLAYRLLGIISGGASGAVLGFFTGGQLGDQAVEWAIAGLIIGAILLSSLAGWSYRQAPSASTDLGKRQDEYADAFMLFGSSAIALISGVCAYGLAFGLGAWTLMALSVGQLGLAVLLSLPTVLYLWFTRRAWRLLVVCLRAAGRPR